MTDEKVYENEKIPDNSFPAQIGEVDNTSSDSTDGGTYSSTSDSTDGGTYSSTKIPNQNTPRRIIAHETISATLNTMSRKIMGAYEFLKMGAIKIGEYVNGVSGEIKISPDGIIGKNKAGETTFTLDGDTGDATFKGDVQAGSVIAGDNNVVIERGTTGGRIVLFNNGIAQIIIGDPT